MCKRIYKEQTSEQGDVPFFKIGTFGANPDAFISNELFEDFSRTYPYPTSGTLLISAAGSIGRIVEYQGEKAYFQDSNIVWLEHDHRLNDAFLKPLYSQIEWGLEGSTIKRLYNKDLLRAEVTIPDGREQKEIGQFFAKLDSLITLHQRKCQCRSLCGYLSWEQRKLNECLTVSSEKNSNGAFKRNDVLSVSKDFGVINQIAFQGRSFAGADLSNYGVLNHGEIVYTKSPLKDNPFGIIKSNKSRSGIVSTLYAIYRPLDGTLANFIDCYFSQDARVNNYLHPLISKGAKNDMKVSAENALKGTISIPSVAEQKMICELLAQLDSLITLHQREPQFTDMGYMRVERALMTMSISLFSSS